MKKFVFLCIAMTFLQVGAAAVPGPNDLPGLRKIGRIDAKPDEIIENVEISNPSGPCVVVPANVKNVIIRNSRIGPCGPVATLNDYGILISEGAQNIKVQGNIIHDVGSGIKVAKSINPIYISHNFFFNIRGPLYNGQAVQFNGVSGGSKSSKIICNVSDANYGSGVKNYEDHISIYRSFGGPTNPIEIAYNRIRGGTSKTGSAITVGDLGGGWINVHDNIVVTVANNGIAVAGGDNIRIENNNVDNRGDNISSMTYNAFVVRRITPCSNITIKGNRGIARLWNWNERYGLTVSGYRHGPELCSNVDDKDNQFGDASLQTSIFEDEPELCK